MEYIALYSKTNPKAYEAAVYNEDTTEPIHTVVEQTISEYDGFNRLTKTEIIRGGVKTAVEYAYNGDGLRVEKTVRRSDKNNTAETTSYLYDRQHVILETRGSESIRYARGINYIARIDNTDKLSYFLYNGHGDVVQTVSEDGDIENQYDYDIFGNPTLTVESYLNSIRYAGEFYDVETGLYYLRARYYDPYIGRFISEDSYWGEDANPLSLNLYTYAHNDPIRFIDPSGHVTITWEGYTREVSKEEAEKEKKHGWAAVDKNKSSNSGGSSSGSGSNSSSGSSKNSKNSNSSNSRRKDSNKVTVTWEGYIIDIDASEYNEYESHGWGKFQGEAYTDKMYNSSDMLDSMTTSSGQKVTIENRGYIGRIETGEGSNTTINNRGKIGTIITGVGSATTIDNRGKVTSIRTGDSHSGKRDSRTTIINYDTIGSVKTGKSSKNEILYGYKMFYENGMLFYKNSRIGKITTGEGNSTMVYADRLEEAKAAAEGEQGGSLEFEELSSQGTRNDDVDFYNQYSPMSEGMAKGMYGGNIWNWLFDKAGLLPEGYETTPYSGEHASEYKTGELLGNSIPVIYGASELAAAYLQKMADKGTASANAIQVPGRVQSRINVSNDGWNHVLKEHFSTKNKSQFTISQDELKSLLQSKDVIKTSVTRTLDSADGIRYIREINVGKNIGLDKFNSFKPTSTMTILTDKYGNLITASPGVIK